MHEVGAGWLNDFAFLVPSMVALVEAADSLPVMLLALPAGALADIVDRRRLLIASRSISLRLSALAMLTWLELTTPGAFGFHLRGRRRHGARDAGLGGGHPGARPRDDLQSANRLNTSPQRLARHRAGDAGVLVAQWAWLVFALNALSCIGILVVLYGWRHERRRARCPRSAL